MALLVPWLDDHAAEPFSLAVHSESLLALDLDPENAVLKGGGCLIVFLVLLDGRFDELFEVCPSHHER